MFFITSIMVIFCLVAFILKYDDCLFLFFVERAFAKMRGHAANIFMSQLSFCLVFTKDQGF